MDMNHPASRITPFGSQAGEVPVYAFGMLPNFPDIFETDQSTGHAPGANMRTATRLDDGSWTFTQSAAAEVIPPQSARQTKDEEARAAWESYQRKAFDYEPSPDLHPPPAYGQAPH
jgi:hypothetical protein